MRKLHKFNRRLASKIMAGKVKGRILTRDGRHVRILAWDARGDWPIVGLIYMDDVDTEMSWQWTRNGDPLGYGKNSTLDFTLVLEVQQKNVLSSTARGKRVTKKKRK